jgi:hypothetical protein
MPDPTILSRDPFQRAKAEADEKYGCWRPLMPTLSACLASSMIMVTAAGVLGIRADPSRAFTTISVVIGVATLLAYVWEWRLLRKKSRLIDQRWRKLSAEAARLREAADTSWRGLAAQRHG